MIISIWPRPLVFSSSGGYEQAAPWAWIVHQGNAAVLTEARHLFGS